MFSSGCCYPPISRTKAAVEGNTVKIPNETKSLATGEAYRKEFFELVNARLLSLPPDMSAG